MHERKGHINLTGMLTPKGIAELKVGQVLMFDYEGSETQIKIVKKTKDKVWGKQIYLYRPEEVFVKDKVEE